MKLKLILSAALLAGTISTQAATENTATLSAGTNTSDGVKALFGDPDVAKGDGFTIKRSELDEIVSGAKANAAAQGQQVPQGFDAQVLNKLVSIQLLLQKATDADRAEGKATADTEYTNLVKRFGSPEAFQRQLTAAGMTIEQLRAKATQEATANAALKRELKIAVTDAEVATYYSNHAADFEEPEMVHVRHILLLTVDPETRTPLSTNTIADKRKQIDGLLKQVRAGGDFAALASQYSEDPGSKDKGGELPEFPKGQMAPEFEATAFSLTNNQISDVITTVYGFHIIQLLGKKSAHQVALNDKVPQSDTTVAADLKDGLTTLKVRKQTPDYVKQLRTEYKVEILDPTLKAEDDALQAQLDAPQSLPDAAPSGAGGISQ
jgi:parvulin-like peptidyl-prolyl isomerase